MTKLIVLLALHPLLRVHLEFVSPIVFICNVLFDYFVENAHTGTVVLVQLYPTNETLLI